MAGGNDPTPAKRRQRERIAASGQAELVVRRARAERLREFFGLERLKWSEVSEDAQHICDLIADIKQFQSYSAGPIITMNIPKSYAHDALTAQQCSRVLRVYSLDNIDGVLDEADMDGEGVDQNAPDVDDL